MSIDKDEQIARAVALKAAVELCKNPEYDTKITRKHTTETFHLFLQLLKGSE